MGLPNIGPMELIIVLAIALLVVGPGKLPEMGSAFGRTIREFRKSVSGITDPIMPELEPDKTMADVTPPAVTETPATTAAEGSADHKTGAADQA
jgi:sec-independent protein translocase protein TatA